MEALANHPWIGVLGWTLIHSIWQGTLVAASLALFLFLLRPRNAHARYLAGMAGLAILALWIALTFAQGLHSASTDDVAVNEGRPMEVEIEHEVHRLGQEEVDSIQLHFHQRLAEVPSARLMPEAWSSWLAQRLPRAVPIIVLSWILGAMALSLRLAGGWWRSRDWQRMPIESSPSEELRARLADMTQVMRLRRAVELRLSRQVTVPSVVGVLKPVILLPACCLTQLSPTQLEAVLAHELAHVRRHDYLVNLLQTVVETLLFFHPAVWWMSRVIRHERECCCDASAVEITGDRVSYARALVELEGLRTPPPRLALAATGGELAERVDRIVAPICSKGLGGARRMGGALVLVFVLLTGSGLSVVAAMHQPTTESDRSDGASSVATRVEELRSKLALLEEGFNQETPLEEALYWSDGNRHYSLLAEGRIQLGPDGRSVARIAPGGRLVLSESNERETRELTVAADESARLEYRYAIDGEARPYDQDARLWLAGLLRRYLRSSEGQIRFERQEWPLEPPR